jgi:hypothetical protein
MSIVIARNIVATIATKNKKYIRKRDSTLVNTTIAKKKEQ